MPRKFNRNRIITGLALVTLLGSVSACGASVDKEQTAKQISQQLTKQVGQRPDSVTCPEDLPAKKDAAIRCQLTADGDTLGVTATVTSVQGTDVKFDIQVDEA